MTQGTQTYRGFTMDNVLHSSAHGDIHFHLSVPSGYDASRPHALFVTLPGWQGLYFQGVGVNLQTEDFAFEAPAYRDDMIIVAPQLSDWGQTSADQTIALVEYLLGAYSIDRTHVFLEGYSGGGETASLAAATRPDLFCAVLHCASRWDGDLAAVADARLPVRLVVGENDEYYGAEPDRASHRQLVSLYEARGVSTDETARLAVLDVKPGSYFSQRGASDQHGAGNTLFARDREVMAWLFNR
ncbi:prolyl oligopeptidase family serine peptidase [Actinomyces sp. ZJ308]|uniref:prolyl oligopeptidase family serine peptidase n=1 Tax=Actinomyces sp. ZJ308 TaxID=2708342 RepID=UPI001AB03047|nr:prolyl oligopeptidase family serine peptidase [Actinomyces sp. ZJ308]